MALNVFHAVFHSHESRLKLQINTEKNTPIFSTPILMLHRCWREVISYVRSVFVGNLERQLCDLGFYAACSFFFSAIPCILCSALVFSMLIMLSSCYIFYQQNNIWQQLFFFFNYPIWRCMSGRNPVQVPCFRVNFLKLSSSCYVAICFPLA